MADNEAPAPAGSDSISSRLPPQLNRLPADKLGKVHAALWELAQAGITEVGDLAALTEQVKAKKDGPRPDLPPEDLTSEYAGKNLWAWTPKRWSDSIQAQGPPLGAKSEDLATNADGDQLPPLPEKLQENFDKKVARMVAKDAGFEVCESLSAWFERMKQADAELRSMASMDASNTPKTIGDGPGVWFSQSKLAAGSFTLPKPQVGRFRTQWSCFNSTGVKFTGNGGSLKPNVAPSVVCLHIGAEGCDVGAACWKRLMAEHQLDGRGRPTAGQFYGCSTPLFAESTTGRYVPRALFAGYDASRMSSVESAGMFAPSSLLVGENVDDCFFDGEESPFKSNIMDGLRQQMEAADFVESFLLTHDCGEGMCLSGLTSSLLSCMSDEYGKKMKLSFTGIPNLQGNDQLPLASSGMLTNSLLDYTDLVNFYDQSSLSTATKPGEQPVDVVARMFSGVTGPMRFGRSISAAHGSRATSLGSLQVNLVPYPRIHFAFPGVASGSSADGGYAAVAAALSSPLCSVEKGKAFAFALAGRGCEQSCAISQVAAYKLSKECDFVDYSPVGFGISSFNDARSSEAEVVALQNTSAAGQVFKHFMDGLASQPISSYSAETIENLAALMKDYEEVVMPTTEDDAECEEDEEY